MIIKIIS